MAVGSLVRLLAGPFERQLCAAYRAVFINVVRCTEQIVAAIPIGAQVIDVGGGDGEILNHLLRNRPDLRVSMLDLRDEIGLFLEPEVRGRVVLHPGTSLAKYRGDGGGRADVLLVSDVVHHVPCEARVQFVADCLSLLKPDGVLIVKDVAPGGLVARLSVLADRYITGDRHVSLLEPAAMVELVESQGLRMQAGLLAEREHPNYAIAFRAPARTL